MNALSGPVEPGETWRMEQFSRAYVAAVAAGAACGMTRPDPDDDSVDLSLKRKTIHGVRRSPQLDLQVKATSANCIEAQEAKFPLKLKNYEELRATNFLVHVAAYLRSKGWQEEPSGYERASLWRYEADSEKSEDLLLPTDTNLRDFVLRMSEVVRTLEQVEDRPRIEGLRALLYVNSDIISLRRPVTVDVAGAIPFSDGVKLVEEGLSLVTAAAYTAVTPKQVVPSRRPLEVQDYLQRVEMGQTEQGSFVLTIISDVSPLLTPGAPNLLELMDEPFPRKVTKTLTDALLATKKAIETVQTHGVEIFTTAVEHGVSANLCEAVVGLLEAAGSPGKISLDVTWAATLPMSLEVPQPIEFSYEEIPVLTEASRFLRASSPFEGLAITGVITDLHREQEAQDGTVTVFGVVNGGLRRILLPLTSADYQVAIEAHREKRGVYFVADIICEGRRYNAINISDFRLA
jgi:hypothetical protein